MAADPHFADNNTRVANREAMRAAIGAVFAKLTREEVLTRLDALLLGAEDLAADMDALRTPAGHEIAYARSALVTTAAAYRLQAIDMVFVNFRDLDGLEREGVTARQLGFTGKMAIHPG